MKYTDIKDRIKTDFNREYEGGYTFSEVESVIAWVVTWISEKA
jgi:hypothetical protein